MSNSNDWEGLVKDADEWILAYACVPPTAASVLFFSIGHAVELYLKASYAKLSGDFEKSLSFGHKIKRLLSECKKLDKTFLPAYEIRERPFSIDFMDGRSPYSLPVEDHRHLIMNQGLYLVAKHLPDLKYMSAPWKSRPPERQSILGWTWPDPYWIGFFREVRSALGDPPTMIQGLLQDERHQAMLSNATRAFLCNLFSDPTLDRPWPTPAALP